MTQSPLQCSSCHVIETTKTRLVVHDKLLSVTYLYAIHFVGITTLYKETDPSFSVIFLFKDELTHIQLWIITNKLSLFYAIISQRANKENVNFKLNGIRMSSVTNYKLLGVTIIETLNLDVHISELCYGIFVTNRIFFFQFFIKII